MNSTAGHYKVVCSCGTVIEQCRCPDKNKAVFRRENACKACQEKLVLSANVASTEANGLEDGRD